MITSSLFFLTSTEIVEIITYKYSKKRLISRLQERKEKHNKKNNIKTQWKS